MILFRLLMLTITYVGLFLLWQHRAHAHDQWADGSAVPPWVKAACCGPADAHHLSPDQVHLTPQGWRVDGYPNVIPVGSEQPSMDGDYWIFYRRSAESGTYTRVYCFFVPDHGT